MIYGIKEIEAIVDSELGNDVSHIIKNLSEFYYQKILFIDGIKMVI